MDHPLFLCLLILLMPHLLASQEHDNTWLLGYDGGAISAGDSTFGVSILTFTNGDLRIENNQNLTMGFKSANASISNDVGELLFYTNCVAIGDTSFNVMENGSGLNVPSSFGYNLSQGCLILPAPVNSNRFFLLDGTRGFLENPPWFQVVDALNYSEIDMQENNGQGKVILKKEPIIVDTLQLGKFTATKHANGRDWWVLANEVYSNRYYKILLTENGLEIKGIQTIGSPTEKGLGQAVFSPDGSKYAMFNTVDLEIGQFIDIYDFDRCTGDLDNHMQFQYDEDAYSGGISISSNSRFLYVSSFNNIYQFDLWSDDIESSRDIVAVFDGYLNPFPTTFYQAQLAPDGKIYIAATGSSRILHVIHRPNENGDACMVEQHGIQLPTRNAYSIPNHPNYRLGPLDGSPCDTLGLDNVPVAKFRYEQPDSNDYLSVEFTDLSYYEPAEWHWDFGDNTTSQDTSPVHVFPEDGTYEICLTVSNQYGEHTFCRTLELGTVSSVEEVEKVDITVFPNPCRDGVNVLIGNYLPRDAKVVLYDAVGQRQKVQSVRTGWNTLHLNGLNPGIYFYEIWEGFGPGPTSEKVLLNSGKLVKVE